MGCNLSSDDILVAQDKELKEYLNKKDIQLVQQTWSHVQDDIEHVGLIMFQRYVDVFPFYLSFLFDSLFLFSF